MSDNIRFLPTKRTQRTSAPVLGDDAMRQDIDRLKTTVAMLEETTKDHQRQLGYVLSKLDSVFKYLGKIVTRLGWV